MKRSPITTHVLDTSAGRPKAGVPVRLEILEGGVFRALSSKTTDADGRVADLLPPDHALAKGTYRLTFGTKGFFPEIAIAFEVSNPAEHHHVPLLLSGYGYSTYRGS